MTPEERAVLDTLNPEHYEWDTPAWQEAVVKGLYLKRDLEGGQMARDMQLFVDDDGKAYHTHRQIRAGSSFGTERSTGHLQESGRDLLDDYFRMHRLGT